MQNVRQLKKPKSNDEIERKWLLSFIPEFVLMNYKPKTIHQSYISVEPELRLGKYTSFDGNKSWHRLTSKSTEPGIKRREIINDITPEMFDSLFADFVKEDRFQIEKLYYNYMQEINGKLYKIEMSKVDDAWYYAEIEFDTIAEANAFTPLPWFGKEVTDSEAHKMRNYFQAKKEMYKYLDLNDLKYSDEQIVKIISYYIYNVTNDMPRIIIPTVDMKA